MLVCKKCDEHMDVIEEGYDHTSDQYKRVYECDNCGLKAEGYHKVSERPDPLFWSDEQNKP